VPHLSSSLLLLALPLPLLLLALPSPLLLLALPSPLLLLALPSPLLLLTLPLLLLALPITPRMLCGGKLRQLFLTVYSRSAPVPTPTASHWLRPSFC
jgi:hypothetical protein